MYVQVLMANDGKVESWGAYSGKELKHWTYM